MPEGGRLTVDVRTLVLRYTQYSGFGMVPPGDYVLLTVADTGCGMDADTLVHIFEPFFSTKGEEKGTGIGLSTVYGILQQSRAEICVESQPGSGASFRIYFPRHAQPADAPPAKASDCSPSGSETILLVEDEQIVRKMVATVLLNLGYTVIEAPGGMEAIGLLQLHTGPIDLLITDVSMPRMNGAAVADKVLEMRPDVKVLFMSGYTDSVIADEGMLRAGREFIQKPFTKGALAQKVRQVLGQAALSAGGR